MYHFHIGDSVKIRQFAELAHTSPHPPMLSAGHGGIIKAFTEGMYHQTDEMYDVLFDNETRVRYILFSDLLRRR